LGESSKVEKPEDFVGWKSEDGLLEVIGTDIKSKTGRVLFRVVCEICSKDKELFPKGYFVCQKHHLKENKKPCGCSPSPRWTEDQFLIRAIRAGKDKNIKVLGYAEKFSGSYTKLNCECTIDNYRWEVSLFNLINTKNGCPKCSNKVIPTEQEAYNICNELCNKNGYTFIGFIDGYKNQSSRLEYLCHDQEHGITNVSYTNFINGGRRCRFCAKAGYKTNNRGFFYIVRWKGQDTTFLKFGITNNKVTARVRQQSNGTQYVPEILGYWEFKDGLIPKKIEDEVKEIVQPLSIVPKADFPDGFTETTYENNLENILKILQKYNNQISA